MTRVIRCDGSPEAIRELTVALHAVLDGGEAVAPLGSEQPPPPHDPGPGQVVVTTSGSTTGQHKWVQLSVSALNASAAATHARLGGPGRWLLALPAQHVAGLQVLVRAALAGTKPGVLDLRDGFDPAAFGAAAQRLTRKGPGAGRCYTALVPTQLARLLDTDPRLLTDFDAVLLGGAGAPEKLLRRARAAGVRLVTTYGLTETAGGCIYDGWPLAGVRIRVNGHVELAGPMLATGYLDDPGQTAAAFRGGWFQTSDLGRLDEHGRLQVLGRADDVIITGGLNVIPADVEAVLIGLPGVATACVVGLPDPEWGERVTAAVVPADPQRPPDPGALRTAARRLLTAAQTPKEIVLLDTLPLRGVGKPDRSAVRALLAARNGR